MDTTAHNVLLTIQEIDRLKQILSLFLDPQTSQNEIEIYRGDTIHLLNVISSQHPLYSTSSQPLVVPGGRN